MAEAEYQEWAHEARERLRAASWTERVAVACRGSANPAALAWLAEGCGIEPGATVVDLGAGLGGPAAWIAQRYRCGVIAVEPVDAMAAVAAEVFAAAEGLTVVRAGAEDPPLPDGAADVALLLGVVSVVDDPTAAMAEAARLAPTLGILDYCATGGEAVEAGGSTFRTPGALVALLAEAGWAVDAAVDADLDSPPTWRRAIDRLAPDDTDPDAREVAEAIAAGAIRPRLVVAVRDEGERRS